MNKLLEQGSYFVCGSAKNHGMGVTWYASEDGSIFAEITLTKAQQGPPKLAHGGATAALLDEAMGAAVWQAGHKAAAINLNINYHKPVSLGEKIRVRGRIKSVDGRKIFATGTIMLPDGTVAVSGKGIYVEAEHLFADLFSE